MKNSLRASGRRGPDSRGFTLIELLIAIAMVGILAGIVLPRLRVERSQVDAAARTVGMALLTARADAVARGHNVLVVFDTTARMLRTVWDLNNNRRPDAGEKSRPFELGQRIVFGRGAGTPPFGDATAQVPAFQNSSGFPLLVVQRNGALDRAGVLYLTSRRGRAGVGEIDTRAVRLDRATGRPTVYVFSNSGWIRQ